MCHRPRPGDPHVSTVTAQKGVHPGGTRPAAQHHHPPCGPGRGSRLPRSPALPGRAGGGCQHLGVFQALPRSAGLWATPLLLTRVRTLQASPEAATADGRRGSAVPPMFQPRAASALSRLTSGAPARPSCLNGPNVRATVHALPSARQAHPSRACVLQAPVQTSLCPQGPAKSSPTQGPPDDTHPQG